MVKNAKGYTDSTCVYFRLPPQVYLRVMLITQQTFSSFHKLAKFFGWAIVIGEFAS
jgi:hypothetical protein